MHTLTGRRIPQLRDRLHREMGSFVSEKSFPIGFVLRRSLRRTRKFLEAGQLELIDDFRACPAKIRDGCFKQLNHARVGSVLKFEDLAQNTNASIFQSGPVQKRGVRRRDSGSAPAVRGSAGSSPTITSRSRAASSTVRVIGPGVSLWLSSGAIPVRLTSPTVGRMPTRLLIDEGARTLPPVSVPIPTVPKFAAIATPVPPLEPPLAYAVL